MTKAIACIILMIGLLKFAQEAPDLFKKIFAAGGNLFAGIDLNPHGQIKRDLTAAGKSVQAIGAGAKAIGNGVAAPFRAGAAIGKGAVGGVMGAKAGAQAGGFLGGARGLVAGAQAGAHNKGFKGTGQAATFAGGGAGAISNKNRTTYGSAQGNYNTMMTTVMDRTKADVDKKKDAIKALEAQYNQNKNEYIQNQIAQHQQDYVNREVNNEVDRRVASAASAAGMTADAFRNDAAKMAQLRNQVLNDNTFMNTVKTNAATDAAAQRGVYETQAETTFKADFESKKSDLNKEIAEAQGKALKGQEGAAAKMLEEFFKDSKDWGDTINNQYTSNFNDKMSNTKMDAQVAANLNTVLQNVLGTTNTYAGGGAGNTALTQNDIKKLMQSISSGNTFGGAVSLDDQRTALAQIMNNMDGAAKKTNTDISVATKAQSTYNPAPASNSGGSGGNP